MVLTLFTNRRSVFIRPEIIQCVIEMEEKDEKTGEISRYSRIFCKDLFMGEGVPSWIDVNEPVEKIRKKI